MSGRRLIPSPVASGLALGRFLTVLAGVLAVVLAIGLVAQIRGGPSSSVRAGQGTDPSLHLPPSAPPNSPDPVRPSPTLPDGLRTIFGGQHTLVAYYGTAGSGSLGVLGATEPDTMDRRLRAAAAAFARPGRPVQTVYELIVTVADSSPGPDGDYSHDIARDDVRRYIAAAHRHHALLLLDLQPGRSRFLDVAKRWSWALADPWVGLALDPEWRMGPHQVPGRVVGHVSAHEIDQTSSWLAKLTRHADLPQKLFVLHEFRTSMITGIDRVKPRDGLALVQHVDGFGTPSQKRATFHAVARPEEFTLGFKLFYRQDVHRMSPHDVLALRPRVRFVSFQ